MVYHMTGNIECDSHCHLLPSWSKRSLYQICVRICLHTLLQLTLLHLTQARSSRISTQVCGGDINISPQLRHVCDKYQALQVGAASPLFSGLVLICHDDVTSFKQGGPAESSLRRAALSVLGLIVLSQIMSNCVINTSCDSC